jgi:hypothetical protein
MTNPQAQSNRQIIGIAGTMPLPIGWSRAVIRRPIAPDDRSSFEFAILDQKLKYRDSRELIDLEEQGFITRFEPSLLLPLGEIDDAWLIYVDMSQIDVVKKFSSIALFERVRTAPSTKDYLVGLVTPKELEKFRHDMYRDVLEDVTKKYSSGDDAANFIDYSLCLLDLAISQDEGSHAIALIVSLLAQTKKAPQIQHWLNVACAKFGFIPSLEDWEMRAKSINTAIRLGSSFSTALKNQSSDKLKENLTNPAVRIVMASKKVGTSRTGAKQVVGRAKFQVPGGKATLAPPVSKVTSAQVEDKKKRATSRRFKKRQKIIDQLNKEKS